MMNRDDDRVEAHLRQFRPRRPGPLPLAPGSPRWPMWAAAAVVVIALGGVVSLWRSGPVHRAAGGDDRPAIASDLAVGWASRLAEWDADALDKTLFDVAARTLPDVEEPAGALRVLASLGNGAQQ